MTGNRRFFLLLPVTFAICAVAMATWPYLVNAQEATYPETLQTSTSVIDRFAKDAGIPAGVLLTDRGRRLVYELRNLKLSQSSLGSKHPTLPVINQRISQIEHQLQGYEPNQTSDNEMLGIRQPDQDNPNQNRVPVVLRLDTGELESLFSRLINRINDLERRIQKLERER